MQVHHKQIVTSFFILIMLLAIRGYAAAQQPKSLLLSANGEGTLKAGREEFKVHAVVAKLMEDGTAEITLVSDITVFISATWSRPENPRGEIDLTITGGASKGGLEGSGKLFLRDDGKSLASLKMQAMNKLSKKNIEVSFVAK